MTTLEAIPTNIITGFLGVGKTTAILNLLQQKPANERWAVLVNEFGEVGIDGSLCGGEQVADQGVFIREVPGGCMCCAASLPMQIALNMLLARAKPHRLIIEPTGLGHPQEVLDILGAEYYQSVVKLQATVTLVDARKVRDQRYTSNTTFNQQLAVADVVVANKADLYDADELAALNAYLAADPSLTDKPIYEVRNGQLDPSWLQQPSARSATPPAHTHAHDSGPALAAAELSDSSTAIADQGFVIKRGQGEGFCSSGWIFASDRVFDQQALYELLLGVAAERIKGVFRTSTGAVAFNMVDQVLSQTQLTACADSRMEIIAPEEIADENKLTQALLNCIVAIEANA